MVRNWVAFGCRLATFGSRPGPVGRPPSGGYELIVELGMHKAESWKHQQRLMLVVVDTRTLARFAARVGAMANGALCRAAYGATRDLLQKLVPGGFPRLKRAVPAMVVVPQSC